MTDKEKSEGETFDLDRIKQLIRLMEKHDLTEVKLEGGDQKWVLKRGPQGSPSAGMPHYTMPVAPMPQPQGAPAPAPSVAAPEAGREAGTLEIISPTVGTFYQSAQPGDPPFAKVGDRVKPETIVCIIEAMKVFNQIPAEVSGTITKVLVQDGEAVEFGQPLFAVTPG